MRGYGGSCIDGGEDGVGGVSGPTFEIAAAEVTFGLEVADHGLDGGASSQFAFEPHPNRQAPGMLHMARLNRDTLK
jgi:hypothetical protein